VVCTLLVALLATDGLAPETLVRVVALSVEVAIVMACVLETSSPTILLILLPTMELFSLESPIVTVAQETLET